MNFANHTDADLVHAANVLRNDEDEALENGSDEILDIQADLEAIRREQARRAKANR